MGTGAEFDLCQAQKEEEFMYYALAFMITEWNLEEDDGKPSEITEQNVRKIPLLALQDVLVETDLGKRGLEMAEKKMPKD